MSAPYSTKLHLWFRSTSREFKWKTSPPKIAFELLMIEVYKYLNGLYPNSMSDIFKLRENTYNLENSHMFESQNARTKKFGLDSIAYRASQLWKNVPEEIRNSNSLPMFKKKIKKFPLISCSCNCYRKYIHHVGFI